MSSKDISVDDLPSPEEIHSSAKAEPSLESLPAPEHSRLGSLGLGAVQGLTLGSADELEGAIRGSPYGALKAIAGSLQGKSTLSDEDVQNYVKARDAARARYKTAQESHPGYYLGGNVAGGIVPFLAGGEALAGVRGAAALGATTGVLGGDADLAKGDLKGLGRDALVGGTIGAAAGAVPMVLKGAASLPVVQKATDAFKYGLKGEQLYGKEAGRKAGEELLNFAGNMGKDVNNQMDQAAAKQAQILNNAEQQGIKINAGDLISQAEDEITKQPTAYLPEWEAARDKLRGAVGKAREAGESKFGPDATTFEGLPGSEELLGNKTIASIAEDANRVDLGPKELNAFRKALGQLGYDRDLKDSQVQALAKRLSGQASDLADQAVPGLSDVNKKISTLNQVQDIFNVGKGDTTQSLEQQLAPFINKLEKEGIGGDVARAKFEQGLELLKKVNPELAQKIETSGMDIAKKYDLVRSITGPSSYTKIAGVPVPIKPVAYGGSNVLGQGVRGVAKSIPGIGGGLAEGIASPEFGQLAGATAEAGSNMSRMAIPGLMTDKAKDIKNVPEKPTYSNGIFHMNDNELSTLIPTLPQDKGNALQNAINSRDNDKKNAILFNLSQTDPRFRKQAEK